MNGCDTFGPEHIWSPDIWSPTIGPQLLGPSGQTVPNQFCPPGQMVPQKFGPHGNHLSMGTGSGGPKVMDQKSGDQIGSGQNASQPF